MTSAGNGAHPASAVQVAGHVSCPNCGDPRAAVEERPVHPPREGEHVATLACPGCGAILELMTTPYQVGLAVGAARERNRVVHAIRAARRDCPTHPRSSPRPSCPECARHDALTCAGRIAAALPAVSRDPVVCATRNAMAGHLSEVLGVPAFEADELTDLDEGNQGTVDIGDFTGGGQDVRILAVTGGWYILLPAPSGDPGLDPPWDGKPGDWG
jgi:hypothetical protein